MMKMIIIAAFLLGGSGGGGRRRALLLHKDLYGIGGGVLKIREKYSIKLTLTLWTRGWWWGGPQEILARDVSGGNVQTGEWG